MAKKKIRKNVTKGIAHVKASHNNTMVTITDLNGETLAWDSAGTIGFKGTRKSTPFAATRAGETGGATVRKRGMHEIEGRITGTGAVTARAMPIIGPSTPAQLRRPAQITIQRPPSAVAASVTWGMAGSSDTAPGQEAT